MYFESHGSGPRTLILLHGFGATSETWRDILPLLSEDARVILLDLKGFGRALKPQDNRYTLRDHADYVLEFIDRQQLERVVLVGNSFGGAVAIATQMRSSRVEGLVLISSAAYPQDLPPFIYLLQVPIVSRLILKLVPARQRVKMVLRHAMCDPKLITQERVERHAAFLDLPGSHQAAIATARQIIPDDHSRFLAELKNIPVPSLILWGDSDRVLPTAFATRLHADIPKSTLHILKDCGHVPQEEKPDETAGHILEFLRSSFPGLNE